MDYLQLPEEFKNMCESILRNITSGLDRKFVRDMSEMMATAMSVPGRLNYTSLAAFGNHTDKTYRSLFDKDMDWNRFNLNAVFKEFSPHDLLAIVLDPSYITKSGKFTPGLGTYWSGSAGMARKGLEIAAVGAIDATDGECMMIGTGQTVSPKVLEDYMLTLAKWYLVVLGKMSGTLHKISDNVVADSYFANKPFADGLDDLGFKLISRLRNDCVLKYLHDENICPTEKGKRGPKQKYDGKVDVHELDMRRFEKFEVSGIKGQYYTAIVYSPSLKAKIRVVIYVSGDKAPKIIFSNNLELTARQIELIYRLRFQIEFCIREAKQFTGLQHSQSRKARALDFSFNLSFALLNVAKVIIGKDNLSISVGKFKTLIMMASLILRITSMSAEGTNRHLILKANAQIAKLAHLRA